MCSGKPVDGSESPQESDAPSGAEQRLLTAPEMRLEIDMLRSVIEASPHGVVVLGAIRDGENRLVDMNLLLANHMAGELLGEDLIRVRAAGETVLQNHPETMDDGMFSTFVRVVETGTPATVEYPYQFGNVRRLLSIYCAKKDDGLVMTIVDITRRFEAEEKLRHSESLLHLAGRMAKMGAWTAEFPSLRVTWSEELYHLHEEPLDNHPTVERGLNYYVEESRPAILHALELCSRDGTPFDLESELITAKGNRIWVRLIGQAEFADGQLHRVYGTVQDITTFKKADEELRESQKRLLGSLAHEQELTRQAREAGRAKSEFLAMMSHEIRTPMNGVIGMIDILAESSLTDMQRDCVETIQSSGDALLTVINDILDFSKLESGMMHLEERPFALRQCIEKAIDLFTPLIRHKRLEVTWLVASDIPAMLIGDANRLRQILINMLGNAVKFTEQGEITLNVGRADSHLLFSISDTGIGIPTEAISRLFQSFQQVDSSTTRRYGGTGLGLAISKRLAESMGGTMWAESIPGAGSTFFFTAVMNPAPIQDSDGPGSLGAGSILVVDDSATSRRALDTQLKAWGMTPTVESSGTAALLALEAATFDVALVDLQMPGMDGVTLAREIHKRFPIPVILMSSPGEAKAGSTGDLFRFQISKPIRQSLLFETLQQITGGTPARGKDTAAALPGVEAVRLTLRILVAEDNAVNQKVTLLMLEKMGCHADLASNGLQVLEALERTVYDLVLMDIQMPEMDGTEACSELRARLGPACPLIVALTANALEGDRERFLAMEFDNYLTKPLGLAGLHEIIQLAVSRTDFKADSRP